MLPQANSLVKFSTPVLVSVAGKKAPEKQQKKERKDEQAQKTEDILGDILPPKEFAMENGQLWVQTVLSTPATRTEVVQLQIELDKRLEQRQARDIGICPVREELFQQCFDELIRQITIDCRQRGLLLVRVRNEYRNQINAYKTLYESSIAYGMRKVIDSEDQKFSLQGEISTLERQCAELDRSVAELAEKIESTKRSQTDKLNAENQAHKKEVETIKEQNQRIKTQIQNALEKK